MTTGPVERRREDEDDLEIEPDEAVVDAEAAATIEDGHRDDPDLEAIVDETRALPAPPESPGAHGVVVAAL